MSLLSPPQFPPSTPHASLAKFLSSIVPLPCLFTPLLCLRLLCAGGSIFARRWRFTSAAPAEDSPRLSQPMSRPPPTQTAQEACRAAAAARRRRIPRLFGRPPLCHRLYGRRFGSRASSWPLCEPPLAADGQPTSARCRTRSPRPEAGAARRWRTITRTRWKYDGYWV